jgi:hypothetical protein
MAITAISRGRRCAKGAMTNARRAGEGGAAKWPMEFTITNSNLERRRYAALSLRVDCDGRLAPLTGANVYFCP